MTRADLYHLAFGAASALAMPALDAVRIRFGLPVAALALAVIVGVAYELVQRIRGEGDPSPRDALLTAAGGAAVCGLMIVAARV